MNTIGTFLGNARKEKRLSFEKLESITKIKKEFIWAIEEENWEKLPEYSVVSGFVRNIADTLDLKVESALALFRRDYPPKTLKVTPNPDVEKKFVWSPKITFLAGIAVFLFVLLGYLGFQYFKFISPPKLTIEKPKEEQVIISERIVVEGKTETDTKLEVNNQSILVDGNGYFKGEVEVSDQTKELTFKAVSRSGKETVVVRKIEVDL